MTEPWIEELEDVEPDVRSDSYAVGRGDRYDGVRVDGTARRLGSVVHGGVSSYNASVPDEEEITYAMDGPDREIVVPDRLYRALDDGPERPLVAFDGEDGLEQYDVVVPGGQGPSYTSVADELLDRYVSFSELPDELEDTLHAAVDGFLMQGTMLYMDADQMTGMEELQGQIGGRDEGVSLLYREDG